MAAPAPRSVPPAMEKHGFVSMTEQVKDEGGRSARSLVAGGLAGIGAKALVAPLDRTKILYQVTNEPYSMTKLPRLMRRIVEAEGLFALWRGNTATMLKVFPYAGIQFMTFDACKRAFLRERRRLARERGEDKPQLSQRESMVCGGVAAALSTTCTYPLDLARTRLAVIAQRRQGFEVLGSLAAWVRHGGVVEIYTGIGPTLAGVVPYGAVAFSLNDQGKQWVRRSTGGEPLTWHKLVIGAFAGLCAQTIAYPFEVVRRRMQTHGFLDENNIESGFNRSIARANPIARRITFAATVLDVYAKQGVGGFYKGVTLNWIKGPIAISTSFTLFDFFQKRLLDGR